MCGICYALTNNGNAVDIILQQYKNQRSRGYEGFGFVIDKKAGGKLVHEVNEDKAISKLKKIKTNDILFHHRLPTSTENVFNACHPFRITGKNGNTYYFVHNGIIWNDYELFDNHEALGMTYTSLQKDGSFNDSESLAIEFVRYLNGEVRKLKVDGSIAFICKEYENGRPKNLYFGHNSGSPLEFRKNSKGTIQISSEQKGRSTTLPVNVLHQLEYETGKITTKKLDMNYISNSSYKSYGVKSTGLYDDDYYSYDERGNYIGDKSIKYDEKQGTFKLVVGKNKFMDKSDMYRYGYDDGLDGMYSIDNATDRIEAINIKLDRMEKGFVIVTPNEWTSMMDEKDYYEGYLDGSLERTYINGY
jgi:hypothetical protein